MASQPWLLSSTLVHSCAVALWLCGDTGQEAVSGPRVCREERSGVGVCLGWVSGSEGAVILPGQGLTVTSWVSSGLLRAQACPHYTWPEAGPAL